ncbi:MAG: DUF2167 domain-containing protein [Pseudomonadales bacterium]
MRYFIALSFMFFSSFLLANTEEGLGAYLEKIEPEIVYGPSSVDLEGVAIFEIEYGQAFLNREHITEIYRIIGKQSIGDMAGWIVPGTPGNSFDAGGSWTAIRVEILGGGHMSGEEDWDYDLLIKSIAESEKQKGNQLLGWIERPNYDQLKHHLSWSFELKKAQGEEIDVYQNMVLGRSGIIGISLITGSIDRSDMLAMTRRLLDSAKYTPGNRYEDYQPGIDKESALGLAALVGGAAVANKFGLFALVIAFFVKSGKFIALGVGGVVVFFGLKKKRTKNREK